MEMIPSSILPWAKPPIFRRAEGPALWVADFEVFREAEAVGFFVPEIASVWRGGVLAVEPSGVSTN